MRRADREISDRKEMLAILQACDVCHLALNGDGYPYVVPLNFGWQEEKGEITLFFHSAAQGTKLDFLAKDDRASFAMHSVHRLISDEKRGYCTMEYRSLAGRGRIRMLTEAEKMPALKCLVAHYHPEGFAFSPAAVPRTAVFALRVEQLTGKAHQRKETENSVESSKSGLSIRPLSDEFAEAVLSMMRRFYASPALLTHGSEEVFQNNVRRCLQNDPYLHGYVFLHEGEPAGYAMTAHSYSTEFGRPCVWVEDLYLEPPFRGRGVAGEFFNFLRQIFPAALFRLEVEPDNLPALAAYRKSGFRPLPYTEMIQE